MLTAMIQSPPPAKPTNPTGVKLAMPRTSAIQPSHFSAPVRGIMAPAPPRSMIPTGGPNAAYANPRTDYDWLSCDDAEVDKYIADPFCGIRFKPESQASFMSLRERKLDAETLGKIKSGLPVYIFVGDADPVNDDLKRLTPLVDAYRAAGLDVTLKVYPGGRHEMLNETKRDEVVADLKAWLDHTVAQIAAPAAA